MNPEHACAAACAVARRHGIETPGAHVLGVWNNAIVHLAPQPLVAKVSSVIGRPTAAAALQTELDVALHLHRAGAPVVQPSTAAPLQVHQDGEYVLTFWRLRVHDRDAALRPASAAGALSAVHRALGTYQGPLPSFLSRQVRRAGRLLADPNAVPELPAPLRAFLAAEHTRLTAALDSHALECRPLHGDPHRGNFLTGTGGCVMIDFESVCSGPAEWDLSALPEAAADLLPADPGLLDILRRLRSVCVATWCWARPGRSAEIDRAARHHLDRLRLPAQHAYPLAA
jgi:hypothetical protein